MGSLGQLAQTLGQLLGQLLSSSNSSGSSGTTASTASTCTSSYYTESTNPTPTDPCAEYVASTASTETCASLGETGTYPACVSSSSSCTLVQELAGTCSTTTTGSTAASDSTNGTLGVAPNTGTAPLAVTFTITDKSGACPHSPIVLAFGDGSTNQTIFDGASSDCQIGATQAVSHTYQQSGTYTAAIGNQTTGGTLQTSSIIVTSTTTVSNVDTTNGTVTPTPNAGTVPLSVSITVTDTSGSCPHSPLVLNYGDGSQNQTVFTGASSTCAIGGTQVLPHTYQYAGNYTLALLNGSTGNTLQESVVIASATSSTASSNTSSSNATSYYSGSGSSGQPSVAAITGTFTMSAPLGATSSGTYTQGNVNGSVVTTPNGATFTANSSNGNTEIAGFFGGNTVVGAVNALVTNWCQTRPWATNFLAAIFPPSFFDGLCTWAGYSTKQSTSAQTPQVTLTQSNNTTQQSVSSKPATKSASTPTAASTTLTVVPKVDIWAVPASVALGSRATIYWNTQGVTDCTESSPDGSFNSTTLSGGANTVPLTQATTYTISCMDTKGNPQTDYVTVGIAL